MNYMFYNCSKLNIVIIKRSSDNNLFIELLNYKIKIADNFGNIIANNLNNNMNNFK